MKAAPENGTPAEKQTAPAALPAEIAGDTPAPEMSAEEAATLAHEGEAEHIPDSGDVDVHHRFCGGTYPAVKY